MVGEAVNELAPDHPAGHGCDRCRREPVRMGDPDEDAVDLCDELETQAGSLALAPDRGFLELRLCDRLDAKVLHGFCARTASTAARARATDASRENPVAALGERSLARCTISATSSVVSVRR